MGFLFFHPLNIIHKIIMALQVYVNGQYFDKDKAVVSVFDHGLLYGDGVFEGLRSYKGKVFKLAEHIKRLYESAASIWIDIPMTEEAMCKATNDTLALNKIQDGYIRIVVTRGGGTLGLDPRKCSNPSIVIITDHITMYPDSTYQNGLEMVTAATIRNHPSMLSPRVKSLNYLNNIMAKIEGIQAGCDEALLLNQKGEVAECTGDNIFIVKDGVLITPPLVAGILGGITRATVIDLAKQAGITVKEEPFTRHDVFVADECFLTGSAAEIIPVVKLDSRTIGTGKPGVMTQKLIAQFKAFVNE